MAINHRVRKHVVIEQIDYEDYEYHLRPDYDYDNHEQHYLCWCEPELEAFDWITGGAIWVHKQACVRRH